MRILIEHENFVPQDERHRVEIAERVALKLRELIRDQEKEREYQDQIRRRAENASKESYQSQLAQLSERFVQAHVLAPQQKGYALEKLVGELMQISGIPVEDPFRTVGEQIDGAIKYDGHFYLLELKWIADRVDPKEIGHFYYKVEGKLDARGIVSCDERLHRGSLGDPSEGQAAKGPAPRRNSPCQCPLRTLHIPGVAGARDQPGFPQRATLLRTQNHVVIPTPHGLFAPLAVAFMIAAVPTTLTGCADGRAR